MSGLVWRGLLAVLLAHAGFTAAPALRAAKPRVGAAGPGPETGALLPQLLLPQSKGSRTCQS